MLIELYNNTQDKRTVDKTLSSVGSVEGALFSGVGSKQIVLLINQPHLPNFNYVYLSSTGRYYYVDNIEYTHKGLEVTCTVDVLMTYKEQIKQLQATLVYSENASPLISNHETVYNTTPLLEQIKFPNTVFEENGTIVMVTLKGNN